MVFLLLHLQGFDFGAGPVHGTQQDGSQVVSSSSVYSKYYKRAVENFARKHQINLAGCWNYIGCWYYKRGSKESSDDAREDGLTSLEENLEATLKNKEETNQSERGMTYTYVKESSIKLGFHW